MIKIVRTKGKAGYFVWKLAGGQGDHDINLPCGSLGRSIFFDFFDTELLVANPLLIAQKINLILTRTKKKGVSLMKLTLNYSLIRTDGVSVGSS